MESLSGNQIQDLKELYSSIYNQTIDETTANLQKLDKEQRDAMKGKSTTITLPDGSTKKVYEGSPEYDKAIKNKNKVINNNNNNNKEIKKNSVEIGANKVKEGAPIIINLPGGGTKKIYPASDEYAKIKSGELKTTNVGGMIDYNITKKDDGTYSGTAYQTTSGLGKVTKVDNVKAIDKTDKIKKDKVKKEKPLLSTKLPDTTKLGSTVKPVKPGSNRDKMIAKNELKFGSDHVSNLRNMDADFKRYRSGEITKMDFMKQYPKSQTAKKYKLDMIKKGKKFENYEPYHIVLGYLLSEGHADTINEAHYVMTQMDDQTVQEIVALDEGPVATAGAIAGALTLGGMGLNAIKKQLDNKKKMDNIIADAQTQSKKMEEIKNVINASKDLFNAKKKAFEYESNAKPVSYTHLRAHET